MVCWQDRISHGYPESLPKWLQT
jgi:hypothetical protein